jgi:uncharacterized membrane protein YgaE (UPF0421/DUF939 family)
MRVRVLRVRGVLRMRVLLLRMRVLRACVACCFLLEIAYYFFHRPLGQFASIPIPFAMEKV